MYIEDSYMCMSFHYNKPLKMTKGGVVLLNDKDAYDWLRTIRYSGRNLSSGVWYKVLRHNGKCFYFINDNKETLYGRFKDCELINQDWEVLT